MDLKHHWNTHLYTRGRMLTWVDIASSRHMSLPPLTHATVAGLRDDWINKTI